VFCLSFAREGIKRHFPIQNLSMSNVTLCHRQLLPVRFELSRPVLKGEVSHISDDRSLENGNRAKSHTFSVSSMFQTSDCIQNITGIMYHLESHDFRYYVISY
jgi:hypothetical protein